MSTKQRIALFFGVLEACLLPGLLVASFGLGIRLEVPFWIVGAVLSGFGVQNIAWALKRSEPQSRAASRETDLEVSRATSGPTTVCPGCGFSSKTAANFCESCGQPLWDERNRAAGSARAGESV